MSNAQANAAAGQSQLLNQLRQRLGLSSTASSPISATGEPADAQLADQRLLDAIEQNYRRCERLGAEVTELRKVEERYQLAMRGANDGLWDWDLNSGRIYFSPRWKAMIGYSEGEIGNGPGEWFDRIHPEDLAAVEAAIWSHLQGAAEQFEIEYRLRHRDGQYLWVLTRGLALREPAAAGGASKNAPSAVGRPYRMAGSQTDMTSRKLTEQELQRDAFHDVLTGLPNRTLLIDRLQRSIARAKRTPGYRFAALVLDMDRFKVVNDSLGHIVGDQLLLDFARRVVSCLRAGDTVARLGGDEFAILLEDIDDETDALRVAERVHASLRRPFVLNSVLAAAPAAPRNGEDPSANSASPQRGAGSGSFEVFATTSIGIVYSAGGYEQPQDLLRDADTAMYRAKASGKAGHQLFDAAMHARAMRLLQLETDLRRAIEARQLEVHYQPIISLHTGKIHSLEALVRWRHPEKGMISPGEFIPVAEEAGLIGEIGQFVLREASRQMGVWHEQKPMRALTIAVNLSAKQLAQHDLVERVRGVLAECSLPSNCLVLEIIESTVMESRESATEMLRRLREMGVCINLDDFGTGYSSLAYLHRIPAATMKIDRSFISRMATDPESAQIVRTIVSLAHGLKMEVTAEGIETGEQLSQVQGLGCEYAQGYLFSKPLDAAAMTQLLSSEPGWTITPAHYSPADPDESILDSMLSAA